MYVNCNRHLVQEKKKMPGLTSERTLSEMSLIKFELQSRDIEIEPCMNSSDLLEFEHTHMTRFPADYRMYLLEIGDGVGMGEGPCREGILPFGKTPFGYPLGISDIFKNLRRPFPFEQRHLVGDYNDGAEEDFDEDSLNICLKHKDVGGYLTLGTSTHSYDHFWILVCEGDCRGEIWIATWSGSFFPCTPRMTFKDWLKNWVEEGEYILEHSLQNTINYPAASSALTQQGARSRNMPHLSRLSYLVRRITERRNDSLNSINENVPTTTFSFGSPWTFSQEMEDCLN
ncbi:MAG: hypothetical protein EXX96DRAFT_575902 [Benjaminiella poitrasii]|nr:MAG: hypothetical protein EXX96DRAFT_575902 [Benjaminiella poitrasii]